MFRNKKGHAIGRTVISLYFEINSFYIQFNTSVTNG